MILCIFPCVYNILYQRLFCELENSSMGEKQILSFIYMTSINIYCVCEI